MPGEAAPLAIPPALLREIYRHARQAFPAECCGWITGPAQESMMATGLRRCVNQQAAGDHPIAAARSAETAYVIAGPDLMEFNRAFDSTCPPRAIYHSHPNGRAYFSQTDLAVAMSPWGDGPAYPVHQLVVGLTAHRVVEAALFAWSHSAGTFVERMRYDGAEL